MLLTDMLHLACYYRYASCVAAYFKSFTRFIRPVEDEFIRIQNSKGSMKRKTISPE